MRSVTEDMGKLKELIELPGKNYSYVQEYGWINTSQFCVWISLIWLYDFIEKFTDIFGRGVYDDGGISANLQNGCLCLDLCEVLDFDELKDVFPMDEYSH